MAYLVLGGSVTAFAAYHWLIRRESPSLIATFAYVNPIVAMMLGVGLAHEHCSPLQLAAAATVLANVILVWYFKTSAAASAASRTVREKIRIESAVSDSFFAKDPETLLSVSE